MIYANYNNWDCPICGREAECKFANSGRFVNGHFRRRVMDHCPHCKWNEDMGPLQEAVLRVVYESTIDGS